MRVRENPRLRQEVDQLLSPPPEIGDLLPAELVPLRQRHGIAEEVEREVGQ